MGIYKGYFHVCCIEKQHFINKLYIIRVQAFNPLYDILYDMFPKEKMRVEKDTLPYPDAHAPD